MKKSRFDELNEKLVETCRFQGSSNSSLTKSSKLLEIDNIMRSIDQQLENCKLMINETLKIIESKIVAYDDLNRKREKIINRDAELTNFEKNYVLPRMQEITIIHDKISDIINEENDLNRKYDQEIEKLCDTRRNMKVSRDDLLMKIQNTNENIKIREMELEETLRRTEFLKVCICVLKSRLQQIQSLLESIENDNYRDSLINEENSLRQRGEKSLEELNVLLDRLSDYETKK